MADNGGGGGGNPPAEEPVDDDIMRDAAPPADGDARADGAVGEVEVVTRVEQPLAVAVGIVSKSLTVAQMKNAGTAAHATLELVLSMPEDTRPPAWTSAYTATTGIVAHGFVIVDIDPAPRTELETKALEQFHIINLSLDDMYWAVLPSAEYNPFMAIHECYTVHESGSLAYVSDASFFGAQHAGKAVFAFRDAPEVYLDGYKAFRLTEDGKANKPRRVAMYEKGGQGAPNAAELQFVLLVGTNAAPGSMKLAFEVLTLVAPRKVYIAGVDQAYLDAGTASIGCKIVAQHFGAVYADEPRGIRAAEFRGQSWTLYFKASEQSLYAVRNAGWQLGRSNIVYRLRDCRRVHLAARRFNRSGAGCAGWGHGGLRSLCANRRHRIAECTRYKAGWRFASGTRRRGAQPMPLYRRHCATGALRRRSSAATLRLRGWAAPALLMLPWLSAWRP